MELVGMGDRIALWNEGSLHEGLLVKSIEEQARKSKVESYRFPQISRFLDNGGDHRSFNEAGMMEAFCITTIGAKDVEVASRLFAGSYSKKELKRLVEEAPLFRNYHKSTDISGHLNEQTLQMVSSLVYNSIVEIDRGINK